MGLISNLDFNDVNDVNEVAALDAAATGTDTGSGTIIYSELPGATGDGIGATTGTTGIIAVGSSVTGYINTGGDHDWYRVQLVAGTTYRFNLDGSTASALGDPYLYLRNAAGALIVSDLWFKLGLFWS